MILQTTDLTLPLTGLSQGQTFAIIVTNAQSSVTLQFRHAGDPTYRDHPDFVAVTPVGTVVSRALMCCSTDMRLVFASAPAEAYFVSCVPAASPTF